ncbi:MAG: helicase-related protein, partial [bacterium]
MEELESLSPAKRSRKLAALQGKLPDSEQEDDDLDEETTNQLVDDYTAAQELDQLRAEIVALKDLVAQSQTVREQVSDSKLAALKKCLEEAEFLELKDGRGKLLIFTEHKDTLKHLRQHLEEWGFSTCEIHGGMNPHERKRTQEMFRTTIQVCVATEAAGEGINLQFCHLMINYDMPWNPTRLEQRLGRIHRIGQERDVYAFNFVATDSEGGQPIIEGRILHRLLEKLLQMNEALEGRVFDVIGEVLSLNDVNLTEMLREAAYDPGRLDEYIDQIDKIDPKKLKEYEEATGIALARSHVDFSDFQQKNFDIEEKRLMPRYVESHFINAAKEVGLRLDSRADGLWRIEHVLAELRADRLHSISKFGKAESTYRKVTFHKHHLEHDAHIDAILMGPGQSLYEAVEEKLNEKLAPFVGQSSVFMDPMASVPYRLHFFEIAIRGKDTQGNNITLHGELVLVKEQNGQFEIVPADFLLNLPDHPKPPTEIPMIDPQKASDFVKSGYQLDCRSRCQTERQKFGEVCHDYLTKSFDVRIKKAQERAMRLAAEASSKPEYSLVAEEARKQVDELQRSKHERFEGLKRLEIARTGPVKHLASVI